MPIAKVVLLAAAFINLSAFVVRGDERQTDSKSHLAAARLFADAVLEQGRDTRPKLWGLVKSADLTRPNGHSTSTHQRQISD